MPIVMAETQGREALRIKMAEQGLSQQALAEKLGIKQPSVSAWLKGESRPDASQRDGIELILGIPREWWRTKEEQERLERLSPDDTTPPTRDGRAPDLYSGTPGSIPGGGSFHKFAGEPGVAARECREAPSIVPGQSQSCMAASDASEQSAPKQCDRAPDPGVSSVRANVGQPDVTAGETAP